MILSPYQHLIEHRVAVVTKQTAPTGPSYLAYDDQIALTGVAWYTTLPSKDAVTWPSKATVLSSNLGDESQKGALWMTAWHQESGFEPANYATAVSDVGRAWFSELNVKNLFTAWPSLATLLSEDTVATKDQFWFLSWWDESGYAPATYDLSADETGLLWYSTLDEETAVTWPSLATVMSSNLADEAQRGRPWFSAWHNESGNAPATYALSIDETGEIFFSPLDTKDAV